MRTHLVGLGAAIVLLATASQGLTAGGNFTRGCAARDLQLMTLLEISSVSPQRWDALMREMMHARLMCLDGNVLDALTLYDDIANSLSTEWALSSHGR